MNRFNLNIADERELYILIAAVLIVVMIIFIIRFVLLIGDFQSELKYINGEIRRTSGRERKHWKKKKRRLWLSLLPFVKY